MAHRRGRQSSLAFLASVLQTAEAIGEGNAQSSDRPQHKMGTDASAAVGREGRGIWSPFPIHPTGGSAECNGPGKVQPVMPSGKVVARFGPCGIDSGLRVWYYLALMYSVVFIS